MSRSSRPCHRPGTTNAPHAWSAVRFEDRVDELGWPGPSNWYVPDIAVVPEALAKGDGALLHDRTLLVVEVTSESDAETDRVVKRRRYTEYRAPLHLLVDRSEGSVTLFSEPGHLGYTRVDGPHPFGTVLRLPDPFGLDLDTSGLSPA